MRGQSALVVATSRTASAVSSMLMPAATAASGRTASLAAGYGESGGRYPLDLVRLTPLMEATTGRAEVVIGLIDGPVDIGHPAIAAESIQVVPGKAAACTAGGAACLHGTVVAGILTARRGSAAPAISPGCTLLVRPIFAETDPGTLAMPRATPQELAAAILECMQSGARLLNISAALIHTHRAEERELVDALDLASRRGVMVVAAAGNQGMVGSSAITRHRWVIPVVSYSRGAGPMEGSNLGASIGRQGLGAPGEDVTSLEPGGGTLKSGGTSVAAPFVSGAAALVWSEFPQASAAAVRFALTHAGGRPRRGVVPPLLDAWSAYRAVAAA